MRKLLFSLFSLLALLFSSTTAQVKDAFQGILPVTDPQMKQSLNGVWDIKVVEGITDDLSVPTLDETWSKIDVPGCWEAYGLCKPTYHHADSLTGYYRTTFSIPEVWKGQRIVLRFDGVLYGYDLWINEWQKSGFLAIGLQHGALRHHALFEQEDHRATTCYACHHRVPWQRLRLQR